MKIQLNEEQKEAVFHDKGPIVVFAGAGSGKTRVITARIAHLIEQGVPSRKIFAVTFTNKAAHEMQSRVVDLCGSKAIGCHIATFHSSCARWLREYANELGFSSDFTIFDDDDSRAALKAVVKSLVDKSELTNAVDDAKRFIHYVKLHAWFPGEVEKRISDLQRKDIVPSLGLGIYKLYQEYLVQCNAMDFDDLLMNMLLLLRRNQRVREHMQKRYDYIMVDEYQDTNAVQFEIIGILGALHKNICVVGDDDQSIYSWRGAVPKNILNFDKSFPGAKVVLLQENYRCTKNIVDAAAALIANNKVRADKVLRTQNPPGDKIKLKIEDTSDDEAMAVAREIIAERSTYNFSQVAVFYRTNAQSRALEEAFRRNSIPYRIFGSLKFYERMEVKDLVAYLRLLVNEKDDVSFRRIINVPTRGIGDAALQELETCAIKGQMSLLDACKEVVLRNEPTKLAKKLQNFLSVYNEIKNESSAISLGRYVDLVVHKTAYKTYLEKKYPDQVVDKLENIAELAEAIERYQNQNESATLQSWLNEVALVSDESEEVDEKSVSMMSLHLAKGLEFDRVFIVGVESGILPHRNSMDMPELLEEERRLFYVGITRARKKLSLYAAFERKTFDKRTQNPPSKFLNEIPTHLIEFIESPLVNGQKDAFSGVAYEYDDYDSGKIKLSSIRQGARVFHPTYGLGIVEEIEQSFGTSKVCVDFIEFGKRKVDHRHLKSRN